MSRTERVRSFLNAPRDTASLAAFRALFGVVLVGSVLRYFFYGWIDQFFVRPTTHFHYYGFEWVTPLGPDGMVAVFVVLLLSAIAIALGWHYRLATAVFFVLFNYVHLIDVTNYLNHYYLVSMLCLLLCVLPLHRAYSVDVRRRPDLRVDHFPAWMIYLVRFQVGIVYAFAALAKLGPDWLLAGQPLGIWLGARTDTPVIGPWLGEGWVALAMSWAGFLYDATIVLFLSYRRTRPLAYLVVLVFHFFTNVFFQIGIFPVVMTVATLIFFDADWPRALFHRFARASSTHPRATSVIAPLRSIGVYALAAWMILQLVVPLRSQLYGGDVLWHEQGMRFSWRVMVREKNGHVVYRARTEQHPIERRVVPRTYLTRDQEREFAGEPDLILQLAHRVRDDLAARGETGIEVRADAWVSLNGRPSSRLIDPDADLARIEDGFAPARYILPRPSTPALHAFAEGSAPAR